MDGENVEEAESDPDGENSDENNYDDVDHRRAAEALNQVQVDEGRSRETTIKRKNLAGQSIFYA